jgi:hypothetical protein
MMSLLTTFTEQSISYAQKFLHSIHHLSATLLLSCDNSKDKELIIGHWTGVEWLEEGVPSALYTPSDASFQFETTGDYTFTYAGNAEQGKYFVSNHELFTHPMEASR